MKGLKLLNAYIERYEELIDIATVQLENGYSKGWYRDKKETEKKLAVLKAIKDGLKEDFINVTSTRLPDVYDKDVPCGKLTAELCWTNYRCILVRSNYDWNIIPIFWTPNLGIGNSHHDLMVYAYNHLRDSKGYLEFDSAYRWAGFYTYGLGNGDQNQLTLYGESSDYPHNKNSEVVKRCFLEGVQMLPTDIIE